MGKIIGALTNAVGNLFNPQSVTMPDTPAMPDPNSTQAKLNAQKKAQVKQGAGRQGTIYSGGGAYGGLNLGGTANS